MLCSLSSSGFLIRPSAMLIEIGAVFLTITRTSTAGSRIFKGARQIWDWNLTFGDRINCSWANLLVPVSSVDASPGDTTSQSETTSKIVQEQLMRSLWTKFQKSQICRAPLKIRLPAVQVRVIVKKIAPTSINMKKGQRQRPLDGREHNI